MSAQRKREVFLIGFVLLISMSLVACSDGNGDSDDNGSGVNTEIVLSNSQEKVAGDVVTLDAATSDKIGSAIQSYQWVLSSKPQNSMAVLSAETTATPTFNADVSGVYVILLTATKTNGSTVSDTFKVAVLEQLTNNSASDAHPYYNKTGTKIAFHSDRVASGVSDIWVIDADGQNPIQITNDQANDKRPSWSPDGTRLIFHSSTRDGNHNLYSANADGSGGLTRITSHTARDTHPKWHPTDELKVAYQTNRSGGYEIWLKTIGIRGAVQLTNSSDDEGHPMWSPDASKIAYSRKAVNSPNNDIWIMNANGSNQRPLTNTPTIDEQHADWSPDGTTLAFRSNRAGNFDVWTMTVDGSTLTQITNNPADDRNPTWHPDGTKILFRSNRTGNNEFFVYPLE